MRLKTVEIVAEEKPWQPALRFRDVDIVSVAVGFGENALRDSLKAVGGRWIPEEKVWCVQFGAIQGTELEKRVLERKGKLKQGK